MLRLKDHCVFDAHRQTSVESVITVDIVPANGRVSVDQNDPLGINRVTVHLLLVV